MAGSFRNRGLDLAMYQFTRGLDLGAPPGTVPGKGYLVGGKGMAGPLRSRCLDLAM